MHSGADHTMVGLRNHLKCTGTGISADSSADMLSSASVIEKDDS